jgi:hypothetical protein
LAILSFAELSDLALITVAAPARTNHLKVFVLQLQGPFSFIVRAGLSPFAACSLNRRKRLTRPLQRLLVIGRDYMPGTRFVKSWLNHILSETKIETNIILFLVRIDQVNHSLYNELIYVIPFYNTFQP